MIQIAVSEGGDRLDAYEGLFGFYTKCGFEPVSWCKWNDKYAPDDWDENKNKREDIIFYKYTGKPSKYESAKEFKKSVSESIDYDEAKKARNENIEGVKHDR